MITLNDHMAYFDALAVFDSLDPVDADTMIGEWRGGEVRTGHPLEGLLTVSNWDGKSFQDSETVFPLVFKDLKGNRFAGSPSRMPMRLMMKLSLPEEDWITKLFLFCKPIFATKKPGARLRMTEFRGKTSATMIYDTKPICDVFRRMDDSRVMGCMDLRDDAKAEDDENRYYFFWLERL